MFISEQDLYQFQATGYLYRGLPMAFIFFKELQRKEIFYKGFGLEEVSNYFTRWSEDGFRVEVMFPDHSYLRIRFDEQKCFVICPQRELYKEFSIP